MPSRSRSADTRGSLIIPQNRLFGHTEFSKHYVGIILSTPNRYEKLNPSGKWRIIILIKSGPGEGKEEEKIMRRMFGFLIGVTVGGLVGSTIALLMAPETGDQLRAELRARGESFFNEVRHAADERKIELRQRLEYMREPKEERVIE
jgi:hypothetical protein